MDSETIRLTISPIFLFCSLSICVGAVVGVFIGLLEQTYVLMAIFAVTGLMITFFYFYERRLMRKRHG